MRTLQAPKTACLASRVRSARAPRAYLVTMGCFRTYQTIYVPSASLVTSKQQQEKSNWHTDTLNLCLYYLGCYSAQGRLTPFFHPAKLGG